MWVRRTIDKVSLLTVGNVTYSGDPRIKVMFIYPNNWRLTVNFTILFHTFNTNNHDNERKSSTVFRLCGKKSVDVVVNST
jgi:hypothetical protein